MKMRTNELDGLALNYMVARAEGWRWARNFVKRSGDSYRPPDDPQFPIGKLFFIAPDFATDLKEGEKNWAGWGLPEVNDEVASLPFYDLPSYSTRWADAGPIIQRECVEIVRCGTSVDGVMKRWYEVSFNMDDDDNHGKGVGDTIPIAAMRAYVASRFGLEVDLPDFD